MAEAKELQVAVLATDGFEEAELTETMRALKEAGAKAVVVAPHSGKIQAFKHHDKSITVPVDLTLDKAEPGAFDALLLPGGALNADALRADPKALKMIRAVQEAGKPIAAICHAPWEMVSAGIVRGRKLTSYYTIQDDIRNAGGNWTDEEVVVDRNWVTSRQPKDIPAFNREMLKLLPPASPRLRKRETNPVPDASVDGNGSRISGSGSQPITEFILASTPSKHCRYWTRVSPRALSSNAAFDPLRAPGKSKRELTSGSLCDTFGSLMGPG